MGVKPGYKMTDAGMIPEDWQLRLLPDVVEITNGKAHEQFIVTEGKYVLVNAKFISSNGIVRKYTNKNTCPVKKDSIILVMSDVPNGKALAKCFLVDADDRYAVNQSVCAFRVRRDHPTFLFYYLNRNAYFLRFDDGIQQTHLLSPVFKRCPVVLPPTFEEQRAIAEALSDADVLIESLEQLLDKKRHVKQGAMQELLTGKKRLPGYSGKWVAIRLAELGQWVGGMTPSMRNLDYWASGTLPWISSGDVKSIRLTTTSYSITDLAVKQRTTTLLPSHSIIVVTRSGILRKYLPVAMNMIPMAINQDLKALIPNDGVITDYVLHSLTANGDRILARCLKSGTTVESIEFRWLKAFTIPFPPTTAEQSAIAAVLSDMDAEIAALETELAKARQIKQGMMQELLTGRIRLV